MPDDDYSTLELIGIGFLITWERQARIERTLDKILRMEKHEMATIQELLDDETVETTELGQLVTVVSGQQDTIAAQAQTIADLQAQQGQLTPEQQAQLDAINAAQKANEATITSLLPAAP